MIVRCETILERTKNTYCMCISCARAVHEMSDSDDDGGVYLIPPSAVSRPGRGTVSYSALPLQEAPYSIFPLHDSPSQCPDYGDQEEDPQQRRGRLHPTRLAPSTRASREKLNNRHKIAHAAAKKMREESMDEVIPIAMSRIEASVICRTFS